MRKKRNYWKRSLTHDAFIFKPTGQLQPREGIFGRRLGEVGRSHAKHFPAHSGNHGHYCYDYDGLYICFDCEEFLTCTCFNKAALTKAERAELERRHGAMMEFLARIDYDKLLGS